MKSRTYVCLGLVLVMSWSVGEARAFRISEPAAGTKVTSGKR